MYKVQTGVPLPQIRRAAPATLVRRKYPLESMAIGDMIFIPNKTSRSVSAYISRASKGMEAKFTVRHAWMARDAAGNWQPTELNAPPACEGVGVWRIE